MNASRPSAHGSRTSKKDHHSKQAWMTVFFVCPRCFMQIALSMVMAVGMLSGCGNDKPAASTAPASGDAEATENPEAAALETIADKGGQTLNIWSWDTSIQDRMEKYLPDLKDGKIGGVKVEFNIQSDGDKIIYQQKLDEAIEAQKNGGDAKVDLFCAERDFAGKYAMAARDAAYAVEQIGITSDDLANTAGNALKKDEDGRVRGVNLEGNACGMIFKKSIAKDALGTDDPEEVQNMCSSWEGMKEVGEKLKAKGYFLHTTPDDMQRAFIMSDETPFGENDTLTVTPGMDSWIDYAKDCCDKGYVAYPKELMFAQGGEYFKGFGKNAKTFCYEFVNWFNGWPLPGNADDAKGDWCLIAGPQPFSWGGTFMFAANGTDNADLCKQVINGLAIDAANLEKWAKDGNYTSNADVNAKFGGKPAESGFYSNDDYFGTLDKLAALDTTQGGGSAYDSECVEKAWPIFADYFSGKESDKAACVSKWQDEVIKVYANLQKG